VTTFIERHGFVKYPVPGLDFANLSCEVSGCTEKRHQQRLVHLYQVLDSLIYFEQIPYSQQRTLFPLGREGMWDKLVTDVASAHSQLNAPYRNLVLDHCSQHGWCRGIICRACNLAMSLIDVRKPVPPLNRLPAYYGLNLVVPEWDKYQLNCPECRGEPAPERQFVSSEYLRSRPGNKQA
jgi:hypothetical protein